MSKRKDIIVKNYLLMRKAYLKGIPIFPKIIKRYMRIVFSCEIPYTCEIHPSVRFAHNALGVVINENAIIEKNVIIYQNVTIGNRNGSKAPIIREGALIGAGACIIGEIVINEYAKIGSNAVVLDNVPANSTAVGIPANIKGITDDHVVDRG